MRELQIRHEPAIDIEGRTHAGAKRDDEFHALAPNRRQSLNIGVVRHAHRTFKSLRERDAEGKAQPVAVEIRGRERISVFNHARKSSRDPFVGTELFGQAVEDLKHGIRPRGLGRFHAKVRELARGPSEQHGFDVRAADIEAECSSGGSGFEGGRQGSHGGFLTGWRFLRITFGHICSYEAREVGLPRFSSGASE